MKTGTAVRIGTRTGVVSGQVKKGRAVEGAVWVRWDDGYISCHMPAELEVAE